MGDWPFQLTTDISIFSLGLLIALGVCLVISLRANGQYKQVAKQLLQLQNETRAMNSGHLGMGRLIRKVSKELSNVENLQQESSSHSNGVSDKAYEQAGLLLSRGATIEEVVSSCEISSAEAELLAIMRHSAPSHNQGKSSQVA